MKHSIPALALGLVIAGAVPLSAQGVGAAAKAAAVDAEMKAMDSNGDGKLSAEEHEAGAGRMFQGTDADKDGKVTAAEMEAAHQRIAASGARSCHRRGRALAGARAAR